LDLGGVDVEAELMSGVPIVLDLEVDCSLVLAIVEGDISKHVVLKRNRVATGGLAERIEAHVQANYQNVDQVVDFPVLKPEATAILGDAEHLSHINLPRNVHWLPTNYLIG